MEQIKLISPYVAVGLLKRDETGINKKLYKISTLQQATSDHFIKIMETISGCSFKEFCKGKKTKEFVQIRHILRFFLYTRLGLTAKQCIMLVPTGPNLNNHSTLLNSIKVVRNHYDSSKPITDPFIMRGRFLFNEFNRHIQLEDF